MSPLPERVEDAAVVPDAQHAIGRGDPVSVGLLGVAEEGVGDPDLSHHVAVEPQNLHGAVELESPVVPSLGEEDVDGVLLQAGGDAEKPQFVIIIIIIILVASSQSQSDSLTMLMALTGPMLLTNMSVWITVGFTAGQQREKTGKEKI